MAIGDALSVAIESFNASMSYLGQQRISHLLSKVKTVPQTGEIEWHKIVGKLSARRVGGRLTQTAFEEANMFKQRGGYSNPYEFAYHWGEFDKVATNFDPSNEIVQQAIAARNREIDRCIIAALDASVFEKDTTNGNTTPSTVAFDTTLYQISADVGVANSSLNHTKLDEVLKKFGELQVKGYQSGNHPVIVCSEHELNQLVREIRVDVAFKGDFTALGALNDIRKNGFGHHYGFDFVVSQELGVIGDDRKCFAYYPTGVYYYETAPLNVEMGKNIDKSGAYQVRGSWMMGAHRQLDDQVIRILCDADATYNAA